MTKIQGNIFKKSQPYFVLLLPLFFVLHGFAENYGFIPVKDALILLLSYLGMAAVIYIFSWLLFRNPVKTALITAFWMSVFFFFGAVHEFLKQYSPIHFFSRYSFLLPATFIFLVWLFIYLKKTPKRFQRFSFFLNALLLIYIAVDLGNILFKVIRGDERSLTVYNFAATNQYTICDTCNKPDIYFLLFDEYAGSWSLKEQYNYDNTIDSFLTGRGFRVQSKSCSNYNFTVVSMASMLNLSFVGGIEDITAITAEDYNNSNILVNNNEVIKFLDAHNYEIYNYSIFNLAGHPTQVTQSFLPIQTRLITERTMFARMNRDIGWLIMTKFPFNLFHKSYYLKHLDNDNFFIDEVKKVSGEKSNKPRFIYAHFNMPHPPFFYDKDKNLKDQETVFREYKAIPAKAYLEYLVYVNDRVKEIVTTIQTNDPKAVILILSDHGFRKYELNEPGSVHHFQNMNAVYYPDKDYHLLYDSITNVNMFRVTFNKIFNQSFPLLPDSTVYLIDKH